MLIIVYTRPGFFSLEYWLWPLFYIMLGVVLFSGLTLAFRGSLHDLTLAMLVGLNFGVMLGVISSITPYYLLIASLVPLVLWMVKG